MYIHVYQIIKNRGLRPHNFLRCTDHRKYFSGLSLTLNRREVRTIHLARKVGEIWRCSCWEKVNFISIYKFKYGRTCKVWPSPLSSTLYNTFKSISLLIVSNAFWRSIKIIPVSKPSSKFFNTFVIQKRKACIKLFFLKPDW